MRRRCCHDKIYSGRTNLECEFEHICMRCGQYGWDHSIRIDQVNLGLYCNLRLIHGWPQQILPTVDRAALRQKIDRAKKIKRRAGELLLSLAFYALSLVLVHVAVLASDRVSLQVLAALLCIVSLVTITVTYNRWRRT